MGWVNDARKQLEETGKCQIRPHGGSMRGRIESGQLVTIEVADPGEVQVDDIVFVKWKGNYLLHLVKEVKDTEILIGNNLGKINGWVSRDHIIGKVTDVQD